MKKETNSKRQKSNKSRTKVINFNGNNLKLLRYQDEWVFPVITYYQSGLGSPIAMDLYAYDKNENEFEPYTGVTVNIQQATRGTGCQFIDTNNNDSAILDWLEDNNFGQCTGNTAYSGFCNYPEFNFYIGKQFMEYKAVNDNMNK